MVTAACVQSSQFLPISAWHKHVVEQATWAIKHSWLVWKCFSHSVHIGEGICCFYPRFMLMLKSRPCNSRSSQHEALHFQILRKVCSLLANETWQVKHCNQPVLLWLLPNPSQNPREGTKQATIQRLCDIPVPSIYHRGEVARVQTTQLSIAKVALCSRKLRGTADPHLWRGIARPQDVELPLTSIKRHASRLRW